MAKLMLLCERNGTLAEAKVAFAEYSEDGVKHNYYQVRRKISLPWRRVDRGR